MADRELIITIPGPLPPVLNPNWNPIDVLHAIYRGLKARAITSFKNTVFYYAIVARSRWERKNKSASDGWVALGKATIQVTIILPPRAKQWDSTNARAALKPAEDALVRAGIIKDDSPKHLTWAKDIKWERGPEAEIRIAVRGE